MSSLIVIVGQRKHVKLASGGGGELVVTTYAAQAVVVARRPVIETCSQGTKHREYIQYYSHGVCWRSSLVSCCTNEYNYWLSIIPYLGEL